MIKPSEVCTRVLDTVECFLDTCPDLESLPIEVDDAPTVDKASASMILTVDGHRFRIMAQYLEN